MLVLPAAVRAAIVAHARAGAPREVVGVLAGHREHDSTARVTRSLAAENAADRPRTRYRIADAELLDLLDRIEAAGEDVLGFYHSHPAGPLAPSPADAARAAWPDHSYVIVSLEDAEPTLGSWRWTDDGFDRERLRIEA